jgi:hypothetical protein
MVLRNLGSRTGFSGQLLRSFGILFLGNGILGFSHVLILFRRVLSSFEVLIGTNNLRHNSRVNRWMSLGRPNVGSLNRSSIRVIFIKDLISVFKFLHHIPFIVHKVINLLPLSLFVHRLSWVSLVIWFIVSILRGSHFLLNLPSSLPLLISVIEGLSMSLDFLVGFIINCTYIVCLHLLLIVSC